MVSVLVFSFITEAKYNAVVRPIPMNLVPKNFHIFHGTVITMP